MSKEKIGKHIYKKIKAKTKKIEKVSIIKENTYPTPRSRAIARAKNHLENNKDLSQKTDATTAWSPFFETNNIFEEDIWVGRQRRLRDSIREDPIVYTISKPVFGLIILMTILMFWRGHQLPGGGFVAGGIMCCGLLLYRIATQESAVKIEFEKLIPIGLATSFITGFIPYILQKGFLKTDYGYITTFITGEFEWATALIFDLGVFLTVLGGIMTISRHLIDINPLEDLGED